MLSLSYTIHEDDGRVGTVYSWIKNPTWHIWELEPEHNHLLEAMRDIQAQPAEDSCVKDTPKLTEAIQG